MICENTQVFAAVRRSMETTFAATSEFAIFMLLAALCVCAPSSLLAQTFTTLYLFGGGGNPGGGLVQGTDGNLYGVNAGGPGKEDGIIFKVTPSGAVTTLHSGGEYVGTLVQGTDGNFYGIVLQGGTFNHGTVFRITPSGTLTTLHNFDFTDGILPSGGLIPMARPRTALMSITIQRQPAQSRSQPRTDTYRQSGTASPTFQTA